MRSLFACLLLFSVLAITLAQEARQWSGCINTLKEDNSVTIGVETILCLHIADGVNWSGGVRYFRASFEPQADEYSRFIIPNSYNDLIAQNTGSVYEGRNITVGAASQQSLSYLRLFYNVDTKLIYPFLTAIVDVKDGVVRGITWDDACVFCDGFVDTCDENTYDYNGNMKTNKETGQPTKSCYISKETCDKTIADDPMSTACDIKLYVVWSGTDSTGNSLQSQAYRFSVFPVQEIGDRFAQLVPTFGLTADDLTLGGDDEEEATEAPGDNSTEAVGGERNRRLVQTLAEVKADVKERMELMKDGL